MATTKAVKHKMVELHEGAAKKLDVSRNLDGGPSTRQGLLSSGQRLFYRSSKRALDLLVASLGLIVTFPVMAVVAGAVAVTMGRPVLFRQERPGLHGELFKLSKFRTMRSGSESDADRLTRLGRALRATSLDELPQLWSVLKGDMTLVGPRPLLPEYLPLYSDRQALRHQVRPGVTGLAQVSGRNTLDWDDRLEIDVEYVETASLSLDLKIIFKTAVQVWRRSEVSPDGRVTMAHFTGPATPAREAV